MCTLDGFPGVDATGLAGSDFTLQRVDGVWSDPADAEPATVSLDPQASAEVLVGWRGDPVGTYNEKAGGFQIVPDGTATGPGVGVRLGEDAYPLDIIDGQEVRTLALGSWAVEHQCRDGGRRGYAPTRVRPTPTEREQVLVNLRGVVEIRSHQPSTPDRGAHLGEALLTLIAATRSGPLSLAAPHPEEWSHAVSHR